MTVCEDFPCCGHSKGGCPKTVGGKRDSQCSCGTTASVNVRTDFCKDCITAIFDQIEMDIAREWSEAEMDRSYARDWDLEQAKERYGESYDDIDFDPYEDDPYDSDFF